jgi:hypothetical protein
MARITGEEGSLIDLETAASWTANYREKVILSTTGELPVKAHLFGREIFEQLLSQNACVGIRIYYALDELGQKKLILVGVDGDGNDMEEIVVDNGKVCPPDCSSTGSLIG